MRTGWGHACHVTTGRCVAVKTTVWQLLKYCRFYPPASYLRGFKLVQVDKISKTIVMNYFIGACRFISVKKLRKIPVPSQILKLLQCQNVPFVFVCAVVQPGENCRWQAWKIRRMHMPGVDRHVSCWQNTWQVSGRHVDHFFHAWKALSTTYGTPINLKKMNE